VGDADGGGVGLDVGNSVISAGADVGEDVGDVEGDGVGWDLEDSANLTGREVGDNDGMILVVVVSNVHSTRATVGIG
jgi:hypothetical protein